MSVHFYRQSTTISSGVAQQPRHNKEQGGGQRTMYRRFHTISLLCTTFTITFFLAPPSLLAYYLFWFSVLLVGIFFCGCVALHRKCQFSIDTRPVHRKSDMEPWNKNLLFTSTADGRRAKTKGKHGRGEFDDASVYIRDWIKTMKMRHDEFTKRKQKRRRRTRMKF